MAASARVQRILAEVRELSDAEKSDLETELLGQDVEAGAAWGEEIDRRAEQLSAGEVQPLSRDELRALLAKSARRLAE